ncbi:MAG: hypothetical protein ACOC47_00185 [Alkalispirochaetaceae bacterium]
MELFRSMVRGVSSLFWKFFRTMGQAHREKVVALTAFEARELENMFVLLLMGAFTGLPAPPSFLSAELLPHLEHELKVLNRRAENASDALAELAGALDIN